MEITLCSVMDKPSIPKISEGKNHNTKKIIKEKVNFVVLINKGETDKPLPFKGTLNVSIGLVIS